MVHTTSTGVSESRASTGRIVIISVSVATVLALFLIFGGPLTSGIIQPDGSQDVQMNQTGTSVGVTPAEYSEPPSEWLQASGSSTGNPGWGPGVTGPFDTLWVLHTGVEIFSPPAIIDEYIYMAGNDKILRSINRFTGDQIWSRSVICGLSGGVAADSQMVYFSGQDGYMYALNRADGSEEWSSGLGYHIFTDACVFADSLILAGNSMGSIAALNRETGEVVWDDTIEGLVIGPAFSDSTAVFCTEAGNAAAWDADGNVLWSRGFTSQPSAPSISAGMVYIGFSSGKVLALSLKTGETLWETSLEGIRGRTVVSRPGLVSDSVLVAGTCDGRVFCLDASDGALLWQTFLENWVSVTPTVCDTIVYASCDDQRIHILSLNTGLPVDTIETGSYSGTPPVLIDGILYAGNAAGDFLAIQGTVPVDSL